MKFVLSKNRSPIHPLTGIKFDYTNPEIYLDKDQAQQFAKQWGCEIAALIQPPHFAIDIDHALIDGQWSQLANHLVASFPGAYVEISRGGDGLHIIGTLNGSIPHKCKNTKLGIECYTQCKPITLTGKSAQGSWSTDCTHVFSQVVDAYFKPSESGVGLGWTTEPVDEYTGSDNDDELLKKALASKSASQAFGDRASFKDLWSANKKTLGKFYPHPTNPYDGNGSDLALCIHLAFWTGKNCERIEKLFAQSDLVRDKWLKRERYRRDTIIEAVSGCQAVYTAGHKAPTGPGIRQGFQYLSVDAQIEYFDGCTYILDQHKILTRDDEVLKPEQFKAAYGGHVFALDSIDDKTTRNAWEAFTESQAYSFPKVSTTCFKPLKDPGAILTTGKKTAVNTWKIIDVPCEPGDVGPFTDLLSRLLPIERDRSILLSYMAACIQHQGVKFQWWPVLQGLPGNGKTFIAHACMEAIGLDHCHTPNAQDLANKFNKWLPGKTFIFIEEIDVQDKRELLDALKPLITNIMTDIQGKGDNQVMGEQCANGMMFTNHRDGVKKSQDDRRLCIFFTAQQESGDLQRDGMSGPTYFPDLWNWARGGGFAHMTHYLRTYQIDAEFNPAGGCHRAPHTSSIEGVLYESLSATEKDIIELTEQDLPGMSGGWISSISIDRYLEKTRYSKQRLPAMLKTLGYIHHPGLPNGRATRTVPFDGGKPKIFVKVDHMSINFTDHMSIMQAFIKAQNVDNPLHELNKRMTK